MLTAVSQLTIMGKRVLDVGTGSGILGLFCAMRGGLVTATDVDEASLKSAERAAQKLGLHVELILSDLFSRIKSKFDLVLFNPPYLPSLTFLDRAVDGGLGGTRVLRDFLQELPLHLERGGLALLLVSTLNDPASLTDDYPKFEFSVIASRPLFFEELQVLGVRFRDDFAG